MQAASPEAKREHLISYLADVIMVTQAAEKKKLADNPEFKRRLAFLRNKLLMGFELQDEAKAALTEEALKQTYNDAVKSMGGQEEVRARHILVEKEDEAKAIAEQLKGGADFATLAKEKSKDPGGADGGDLGYFTKDQMVPEFADVAFKMYPGQLSNPVKSQFGWHIIKVEDKRTKQPPEFEKVKDQIEAYVARKAQSEFVAKLRQTAKIERLDKPAEPKQDCRAEDRTDRNLRSDWPLEACSVCSLPSRIRACRSIGTLACRRAARLGTRFRGDDDRPMITQGHGTTSVSPLAPAHFPDMPPIEGVRLATAAAGIRYAGRTDVLLALFDPGTRWPACSRARSAPPPRSTGAAPGSRAARRARSWSIPAMPMPSPASPAGRRPSSPPRSPPWPPAASPRTSSSPRPA